MKIFDRKITQRGKTIFGGLVLSGAVAGGIFMNSLDSSGLETSKPFPAFVPICFNVTATGSSSATQKYDAIGEVNPFSYGTEDNGSGTVVRATYHNVTNPAAIGGDLGFVGALEDKTASGTQLIDNVCTNTGCISFYTTGTQLWAGSGTELDVLKLTLSGDPTSSYEAKVCLWYEDILGD